MSLVKFYPYRNLADFQDRYNKFYYDTPELRNCNCYSPSLDITDNENNIFIEMEIPGIEKSDLKITLENNILTLEGEKKKADESEKCNVLHQERKYGSFKRTFKLSDEVTREGIDAEYKNGLLLVTLTKSKQQNSAARDINVK